MVGRIAINNTILVLIMVFSVVGFGMLITYVFVNGQRNRVFFWFQGILLLLLLGNLSHLFWLFAPKGGPEVVLMKLQLAVLAGLGPSSLGLARAYRGKEGNSSVFLIAALISCGMLWMALINPYSLPLLEDPLTVLWMEARPLYYGVGVYLFLCFSGASYYFLEGLKNPSSYWRNQVKYVGGAGLIIAGSIAFEMFGILPEGLPSIFLVMPIALLLLSTAVLKYQFLGILPFTISEALNFLDDGYMIFDHEGHLESFNLAMLANCIDLEQCQTVADVMANFGKLMTNKVALMNLEDSLTVASGSYVSGELVLGVVDYTLHLQYITKAVVDSNGVKVATMITLHDMTKLQILYEMLDNRQEELIQAGGKLADQMAIVRALTMETERNSLMSEVHDTLGHSMAEVLAILEKTDMLLEEEGAEVQVVEESLNLALDKSRMSLAEIRRAVSNFKQMGEEG